MWDSIKRERREGGGVVNRESHETNAITYLELL